MQLTGRRFDTGQAVCLTVADSRIQRIDPLPQDDALPWLAPGLIDLQVNGYGGQEFNDLSLTTDRVPRICRAMDSLGVTQFCPTTTTHGYPMLSHVVGTIAAACEQFVEVAARIVGIHLEGPYISAEDGPRGAHPREHCRPPDWDEFQRLQVMAGGRIRILTMSPEYENSHQFIQRVADSGVVVAIGHTAANSEQIRAAVDAGARLSTHLGNGAHGLIRRHPNYIWDQLADDRLMASLIVDGHHLPPEVVKTFVRAKSADRCLLVSDITGLGGMPPGRYESTGLASVEVLEDGRLVVAGQRQYLAGAALPLSAGIVHVMSFAQVDLATAIRMASQQPARLMGLNAGQLQVGATADLIQFQLEDHPSRRFQLLGTIKAGSLVHGSIT